jgi:hypothetical protein
MLLLLPPGDTARSVALKAAGLVLSACDMWACLFYFQECAPAGYGARIRYSIGAMLLFGLSEHFCHPLFGDIDRKLIIRQRQGWKEKIDGWLSADVRPGPILFWSLHVADVFGWPPMREARPALV